MSDEHSSTPPSRGGFQLPPWLIIVLLVAISAYSYWKSPTPVAQLPTSPSRETPHAPGRSDRDHKSSAPDPIASESDPHHRDSGHPSYLIENQIIRDLNGKIILEGTVNIKPTLDRIARGGSNQHRNDGTVFQNREGQLPRKSHGYYKEYVHPTPGEHGPGPQRIIIGQDGDIWYTPDHYRNFIEIKKH